LETTYRYKLRNQGHSTTGVIRIGIYARLSKNRNGLSTNTSIQVAECLDEAQYYAKQHSLKLAVAAIFEENDVSASKYSTKPRPDYLALIDLVSANKVDVIFATEMERLCRRPRETEDLIDLAETTDLREIYLTSDDGYNLGTANGVSRARDAVNRADRESRKISERIKRKLADRASEGVAHGGPRPYGYKPGGMELEDSEVIILRKMGTKVINGQSCREIAYWANEQGFRTAEGRLWQPVTVQNSLRRPRYVGVRVHKDTQYPAKWPPIFDQETWDKIQVTLQLSANKYADRPVGRKYLLTGLLYCGRCGTPLNGSTKKDSADGSVRRVYCCRTEGTKQRRRGCGGVSVNAEALDHWITEAVMFRLETPDLEVLLKRDESTDGQLRELLGKRQSQQLRLDGLIQDYATQLLNRSQFALAKSAAERKLKLIESDISRLNAQRIGTNAIPIGSSLRAAWTKNESNEWRRSLLDLIFARIDINPSNKRPYYHIDGKRMRFDPERVVPTWRV
jgi:DNA invertase Pin-like site-specific DNA recombinase